MTTSVATDPTIAGVPTQPTADDWARRNSHGLIERFPLQLRPATVLVLGTGELGHLAHAVMVRADQRRHLLQRPLRPDQPVRQHRRRRPDTLRPRSCEVAPPTRNVRHV
ncbi:hypothetical protein FAGKG844_50104 [Frankia sp. AgKG'84/4]